MTRSLDLVLEEFSKLNRKLDEQNGILLKVADQLENHKEDSWLEQPVSSPRKKRRRHRGGNNHHYTPEERSRYARMVRDLAKQNPSQPLHAIINQVARKHRIHKGTLRHWVDRRLDEVDPPKNPNWNEERILDLVIKTQELWKSRKDLSPFKAASQVAEEANVHPSTLYSRCTRMNVFG